MNKLCNSESPSDEPTEEEDSIPANRIFLNFAQNQKCPMRDALKMVKVSELFRYLSERQDLQEMKVSGWSEQGEEDDFKDDFKDESSYGFESTPRDGGQRFAMSRDFWYQKLNTLKAQKLDEVALEAKDIGPRDVGPKDDEPKDPEFMKWIKNHKIYSSEIPEKKDEMMREIREFQEAVAKPVEKKLKTQFINIYDNRNHFNIECETEREKEKRERK